MAITTTGSGNWSSTVADAPWPGGVVPTIADDVTVALGHTVTLDGACEALTVVADGAIAVDTTISTSIKVGTTILINTDGSYQCDLSASASITHRVLLNANSAVSLEFFRYLNNATVVFKGFPRKRRTELTTAIVAGVSTSCDVVNAGGWQVGDTVIFATTDDFTNVSDHHIDTVTIDTIVGNTITWVGAVVYDHKIGGVTGNFSSNVSFEPVNPADEGSVSCYTISDILNDKIFSNVLFYSLYSGSSYARAALTLRPIYNFDDCKTFVDDCVFYQAKGKSFDRYSTYPNSVMSSFSRNISYTDVTTTSYAADFSLEGFHTVIDGNYVFKGLAYVSGPGILSSADGQEISNCGASGCFAGVQLTGKNQLLSKFESNSNRNDILISTDSATYDNCRLSAIGASESIIDCGSDAFAVTKLKNCTLGSPVLFDINSLAGTSKAQIYINNRDGDVTKQEVYSKHLTMLRDNLVFNRSKSSICVEPLILLDTVGHSREIPCANGSTIRVVGYVRADSVFYNAGVWTPPAVTLSGLGEVDIVFTASASAEAAWEKYDISITNNSGADGSFELIFSATASDVLGGEVYFDGVPDSPFITKCRHYGFLIDETNPTRKVDLQSVATEAVAIAYTGVTVNGANKEITFSAGTIDTYQKMYDYVMAFVCANLDVEIPFTRSSSLFSITSGWTVVEPTLDNVWDSGTMQWDVPAAKSGSFSNNVFDFTVAGIYDFGSATFDGSVELVNTSGGLVDVALPVGTVYVNTGPDIMVTTPINYVAINLQAKDYDTLALVPNVTMFLEADAGGDLAVGTDIIKEINATGSLSKTDFVYTNDQPVVGRIRVNFYETAKLQGVITSSGLDITAFMLRDDT